MFNGATIGTLYMIAPILMALAKLMEWEPFGNMGWIVVTAPWWYLILIIFTTGIVKHVWYNVEVKPSKEGNPSTRKDLH